VENQAKGKQFDISPDEANLLMERVRDLISDKDYRPFYFKHLKRLGQARFLALAEQARQKDNPVAWFAKSLKYAEDYRP
jgi:hypothetical protein